LGNQQCKPICADLPQAPINKNRQIKLTILKYCPNTKKVAFWYKGIKANTILKSTLLKT